MIQESIIKYTFIKLTMMLPKNALGFTFYQIINNIYAYKAK